MKRGHQVTMKEIAKKLNVSVSTVSRALKVFGVKTVVGCIPVIADAGDVGAVNRCSFSSESSCEKAKLPIRIKLIVDKILMAL